MRESVKIWLEALRSGEYKQCQGQLEVVNDRGSAFCCLGVATLLAEKAGIKVDRDPDSGQLLGAFLPEAVQHWLGAKTYHGDLETRYGHSYTLAGLNDSEGLTFPQIADVIEARYDELFYPRRKTNVPNHSS